MNCKDWGKTQNQNSSNDRDEIPGLEGKDSQSGSVTVASDHELVILLFPDYKIEEIG